MKFQENDLAWVTSSDGCSQIIVVVQKYDGTAKEYVYHDLDDPGFEGRHPADTLGRVLMSFAGPVPLD